MATKTYYDRGRFKVTGKAFRTKKKTFVLARIEKTSLHKPLLVFAAAFALGAWGFAVQFSDLIFAWEMPALVCPPIVFLLLASRVGVIYVDSKALGKEIAAIGPYGRLFAVRQALDRALEDRMERPGNGYRALSDDEEDS